MEQEYKDAIYSKPTPPHPYKIKSHWNYRKADGDGKRCKLCESFIKLNCKKPIRKCNKLGVTNSILTDIKPSYVCDHFKKLKKDK